ncbi:hypothetical protein BK133_23345 [Paenibacillus sp. FSL H8-0548]|uniref:hypothetical protein n=1 Tax=Paenibacillus sp. FSL H8-0548 TaxID=1920422 RepID=UPI00096C1C7F|nr:hypothetical protein [Paenibacillus sp. FSL H8-0548]OMF24153.1 hypothetical protein BK133_23345 [Paenibacillus sp. FSL H8-0548]
MRKFIQLAISLALVFVFTAAAGGTSTAEAASEKVYREISKNVTYYGQLKDGKPHGKGTMTWYATKTYSGDWVDGFRTGSGKYVNRYESEGKDYLVTYDGEWKNDMKSGTGTLLTKITGMNNKVEYHKIQFGTFTSDRFATGYSVKHSTEDHPYSFNYKDAKMNLQIFGTNVNMKQAWKDGKFHTIQYSKGNVMKHYSITFDENPSLVKQNKTVLTYLKGLQSEVNPHLVKLESLSVRVPLK